MGLTNAQGTRSNGKNNLSPSGASIPHTKAHPSTGFKGQAGMSLAEFRRAQAEYDQEMQEYRQALDEYYQVITECVGQKGESCA
jgi:hypothetical protein